MKHSLKFLCNCGKMRGIKDREDYKMNAIQDEMVGVNRGIFRRIQSDFRDV